MKKRLILLVTIISCHAHQAYDFDRIENGVTPARSYEYAEVPPFVSNLHRNERERQQAVEKCEFAEIVEHVIDGDRKQLDRDAQSLAAEPGKLDKFLTALPSDLQRSVAVRESVITPAQIDQALADVYASPELGKHPITLTIKRADIRDAVELIARQAKLNLLIDSDVVGFVSSFRVCSIPVADALRALLEGNKPALSLVRHGLLWRVMLKPTAQDSIRVQLERTQLSDTDMAVVTMHNMRWSETFKVQARCLWQCLLEKKKCGLSTYLVINDETRKLFFRGPCDAIQQFKRYLAELDIVIPQISIEARVVVARYDFEKSFGTQWSGIYNQKASVKSGFDFVGVGPLEDIQNEPVPPTDLMDWVFNLFPTTWEMARNFEVPFVFGGPDLRTRRLNIVLNAAENRGEIRTILKPSILTNDRELAEILEGEVIPIETIVEESVEGRLRNVRTASYKDVGIQMRVRPQATPDHRGVHLDIFVENSVVDDTATVMGRSDSKHGSKNTAPLYPTIITSRTRSRVMVANGATTMISGLIKNRKRKERTRLPILGSIPVLKWFFGGYRRIENDLQLIIFITPRIVDGLQMH